MFSGYKKGFSLLEVIISFTISTFIIIALASAYFLVTKTGRYITKFSEDSYLYEFLLTLQRGLFVSSELKVENKSILSFLTNYGLSKPYVRVFVKISKGFILYEERNPYNADILLFKRIFKINCENVEKKKDYILLNCKNITYKFPYKEKQVNPFGL